VLAPPEAILPDTYVIIACDVTSSEPEPPPDAFAPSIDDDVELEIEVIRTFDGVKADVVIINPEVSVFEMNELASTITVALAARAPGVTTLLTYPYLVPPMSKAVVPTPVCAPMNNPFDEYE
jgi:hypothetical protein